MNSSPNTFTQQLQSAWASQGSMLCIGLDPDPKRLPPSLQGKPEGIFEFCREIADATADLACSFKPQFAYFASQGAEAQLEKLIAHLKHKYPKIPVILDSKRGDIGSTAEHYAMEAFERYGADAVTVSPYMGFDSVEPYLRHAGKGVIILCRTSNPGGSDLQFLNVAPGGEPLYLHVAKLAAQKWNSSGQISLVVGATFLAASAKSDPELAYKIARDELIIIPIPGLLAILPALTVASISPPCAPIPGISSGISPTTARTLAISSGNVAPTTKLI